MTEREINRIRKKFILLSTLSFFGVMLLMGGCIYLFSMFAVRNEVRRIMDYIVENDGQLPIPESESAEDSPSDYDTAAVSDLITSGSSINSISTADADTVSASGENTSSDETDTHEYENLNPGQAIDWNLRRIFGVGDITGQTADSIYSTRYFAVLFDADGEVEDIITSHIASIDRETAERYASLVLHSRKKFGSFGRYFFHMADRVGSASGETSADSSTDNGVIVIYLDRSAQLMSISRILFIALTLIGFGTLLAYHFMRIFSKQVVRSEVETAERQKQFITNASHELKTPLAVIRANTEMQEMLDGETEWTQSTMRQVDRLNGLVQNLVQIARSQETATGELTVMNIAPAVLDTAESFIPVATGEGKTLVHKIAETVSMEADESMIRQLVSLLLDNAVKYCDPAGKVRVTLGRSMRAVILTVSNDYADGASVDYTRFFERFYRENGARTITADAGPNSSSGSSDPARDPGSGRVSQNGYGVGLSIADELVKNLHGTIQVFWKNGVISFVCRFRAAS